MISAETITRQLNPLWPEQADYLIAWLVTPPRDRDLISDWTDEIPARTIDELGTLDRPGRLNLASELARIAAHD